MSFLDVGYSFWNPIILLIGLAIAVVVVFLFWEKGEKKYKKDTQQVKIFLSGEDVPPPEKRHLKSNNVYWGFFETLKGYYTGILKPHTGIINDYIVWLVAVIAITALVVLIAG